MNAKDFLSKLRAADRRRQRRGNVSLSSTVSLMVMVMVLWSTMTGETWIWIPFLFGVAMIFYMIGRVNKRR